MRIMRIIKILPTLALTLAACFLSEGQNYPYKTRKQLLKENEELKDKISKLENEIQWYKNDINEKDSLRNELLEIYEEGENKLAAGLAPEDYNGEVTDSLLSLWYLHRQSDSNKEGSQYNMDSVHFTTNVPDKVLIERLEKMNSFITLPYNETVKNYMILYSEKMPRKMSQMLGLAKFYMPVFEETFVKYGLPVELKYLAIIESALNPNAVSRVGATGMWQFMYNTAKSYGLEINSYVDERRDPYVSVDAAARYLRDAYRIFGDWSLAISSYNCGSGNVNKAIKKCGGNKDFWSVYQYLPRETRGYVPAMVGAMYAINYAKEYGIEPTPAMMPAHLDTFHIHKNLHFQQITEVIGIPIGDLRNMNPQYYKDIVPGNQGEYILRLPFNYCADFVDCQDTLYKHRAKEIFSGVDVDKYGNGNEGPSVRTGSHSSGSYSWVYYKVKSGDSLGKIASRYHTTVSQLKSWNGIKGTTIRAGQSLKVGKKHSGGTVSSSPRTTSSSSSPVSYTYYTVKSGDTLYSISRKYPGVTANDIMKFNGIGEKINVGMKLKIPKK